MVIYLLCPCNNVRFPVCGELVGDSDKMFALTYYLISLIPRKRTSFSTYCYIVQASVLATSVNTILLHLSRGYSMQKASEWLLGHIRKITCLSSPPVRIFLPVLPVFILYVHAQPPSKGRLRRQPCQLLNWCKGRGMRRCYIVGLCFRGLQFRGFGWWECDPG